MTPTIVTTSWDDGHVLDLRLADLLTRYGLAGTFYVSPQNREFSRSDLLPDKEVVRLGQKFEIGAHTLTHPRLTDISTRQSAAEIRNSKKYLETLLDRPVTSFCYPGGEYHRIHPRQVAGAGFNLARTTRTFAIDRGPGPFRLPTTVHAYDHWSGITPLFSHTGFNPLGFAALYHHWDRLAVSLFDRVKIRGGIFHLWGHSWEIDSRGDWLRLEKVFRHISRQSGVRYVTNRELNSLS